MLTVHANVRTRAGCWTCRARRKKCDETRPHCLNCSNLRVPCQGYQVRLKWLPQQRLSAGRAYRCDDNPPKQPLIPSSGIPELDSKPLVYYLGVEGFDSLTDMAKRILQDFVDWGAAQLVSSVRSHSERYFEVFAGSKALVAGCIAFQVTLDLKYAPLVEQCYIQSVKQFRHDLAYPELVERKATIYAGLLLCSTSMMHGLPWTVHLNGISSILLERDVLTRLNEQTADFVPLIGVMDLPTHTLGRRTETLHIWYKHCRLQTGIDDCLGLPCSLVDLLCAVMEPGIIQRLLLWPSEHGTPEEHIMWDLTRYGGIIMAQNYQLENGLAQRQNSTVPEDVTVAFAVRHIITTAHKLRAEAGSLTRGLWSGLLFPLVAAASQPPSLSDVDRSLVLDCITDLADGVLDNHPYYKQVIVVLQAFWEQKNTRSLQRVARDLNLEIGLF